MYCTYENKYKFVERSVNCCRDPAPHGYLPHVFSDERNNGPMMFYFLACTFWALRRLGLKGQAEGHWHRVEGKPTADTFIVPYFHVLTLEL